MVSRARPADDSQIIASIVVPCYKEAGNVNKLTERVFKAIDDSANYNRKNTELIFVDDNSRDGSVEKVNALASNGYPVRIIVRTQERGLSSAVLEGFRQAKGKYLLCMDADLQHPPESVPKLLDVLVVSKKEFVIGTRYGKGVAIDESWPMHRRVISKGARLLARPLTPLSDPMTGFFGLTKEALSRAGEGINKQGFKICLELYAKCKIRSFGEVPFSFGVREEGESKLTGKVIVYYLQQLMQLYTANPVLLISLILVVLFVLYIFVRLLQFLK
eukprot:Phypoly_transcript_14652.p1 GENE.Phypoly_transcript_14652~~Phypoly_transcript_14652.p1  ORF type:complete len:274 (+),score=28.56 Phypoly_transcript_14652:63-884(+)